MKDHWTMTVMGETRVFARPQNWLDALWARFRGWYPFGTEGWWTQDRRNEEGGSNVTNRVVWVIEKGSPAQYFKGFDYGAGKWTPDFTEALKSSDRDVVQRLWDCDVPIFTIYNDECRIADHMICGGPE